MVSHHADEAILRWQLGSKWEEYKWGGFLALTRSDEPDPGWNEAELVVLHGYTRDEYRALNQAMRGELGVDALSDWLPYQRVLVSALNKLPDYEGVVFRGVQLDEAEIEQYDIDVIVTWDAFSSCTTDELQAFSGNIEFILKVAHGKSIRRISAEPAQEEVILLPGTGIRVLEVEKRDDGVTVVYGMEDDS